MKAKILNKILLSLCLMFVLGRAMTHAEDDSPTSPQEIAETPIPTATPNATEVFTTAHDGTCLQWDVYLPEAVSATPRPVVLVVHIGAFRAGSRKDSGAVKVATTLRDAGFIACSIDYRLDVPANFLPVPSATCLPETRTCEAQTTPAFAEWIGESETQASDVRKAIYAARHPPSCSILSTQALNGKVGIVGGSAGASHALACAASSHAEQNRPDAVVCLSGAYQFDDPESLADTTSIFHCAVMKYCNIVDFPNCDAGSTTDPRLTSGSPVYHVDQFCAPVYAFGSQQDSITSDQLDDLQARFTFVSLSPPDHQTQVLQGSKHAFAYWSDKINNNSNHYVYRLVLDWLEDRLY